MLNQTNASKFPKSPPSSPANPKSQISKHNFSFLYVIGKGGFGRVWKVKNKKTEKLYALKEMSKLKVLDKKAGNEVWLLPCNKDYNPIKITKDRLKIQGILYGIVRKYN
jgi:serine/threonine protein kinase